MKRFNDFVKCPDKAQQQEQDKPQLYSVTETLKTFANSSFGYEITDSSCHLIVKYLNDEGMHSAIKKKPLVTSS